MMYFVAAAFVSAVLADVDSPMSNYKCPGSYSPVHAWAVITADFDADCDAVQNEVMARLHGDDGWKDPRGGKYTIEKMPASNNGILQVKRVTGNHLFTDRVDIQFIQTSNGNCEIKGCSESQGVSAADGGTNFCNIHDLYCSTSDGCYNAGKDLSYDETNVKVSPGAGKNKKKCFPKKEEDLADRIAREQAIVL